MRLLIPFCPVAIYLERDDLMSMWGVTFSDAGLAIHFGDWSLVATTE